MAEPVRADSAILSELFDKLERARSEQRRRERPFVTLSYAQSLDGSIAGRGRRPLSLSGPSSLALTHELRAAHDAILVGIGTVLTDDPRLNVRLASGSDPRPIVVDSRLRLPAASTLLERRANGRGAWVAATSAADPADAARLSSVGAEVLTLPALENGWVDLVALSRRVGELGVSHVLVEGGARILGSFLEARLADYAVVTVAPQFVGGVPALSESELSPFPRLTSWRCARVGDDLVLAGELSWDSP